MDKIYHPKVLNVTQNINIKEYFDNYSKSLFDSQKLLFPSTEKSINSQIFSFMNLDEEHQNELKEICSVTNLSVSGENNCINTKNTLSLRDIMRNYKPMEINEKSKELHTVQNLLNRTENINIYKTTESELECRFSNIEILCDNNENPDLIPGENVVLYLRFFQPFKYDTLKEPLTFDFEIAALGKNTLAQLRDQIKCTVDLVVLNDVSANPKEHKENMVVSAKEKYPSGFIFMDGVFYNDFREKHAIDYSEVIRKWAEEKEIGNFETAEMYNTRLIDLKPRFGYPYVYQHQCNCEHIFIFSHAKLLTNQDPLNSKVYPFFNGIKNTRTTYCIICGLISAIWLVTETDIIPQDQALLCNDCFLSYFYVNGEKVGHFKAYPYRNRNNFF